MSSLSQPLIDSAERTLASRIARLARDYSELTKARVTTLILMTAWCGFFFGAAKEGVPSLSLTLLHALIGIGLVSAGTAAMNEVMERNLDGHMRRTSRRPLVTGSISLVHGFIAASSMILGGTAYLWIATNPLTSLLTAATCAVYLLAYTPLKTVHPICTFIGAFPGAMPPVLGWTAIRGRLDIEAIVLFLILFLWQFPHFHSIAWLYREDYERASIRMLPVVESDGRSTVRAIVGYSLALIPATLAPTFLHMAGWIYFIGAAVLGTALLWVGMRLWRAKLAPVARDSKPLARHLLRATVLYLPLLFALMMLDRAA